MQKGDIVRIIARADGLDSIFGDATNRIIHYSRGYNWYSGINYTIEQTSGNAILLEGIPNLYFSKHLLNKVNTMAKGINNVIKKGSLVKILDNLNSLMKVGLDYATLDRVIPNWRVEELLVTHVKTSFSGTMYVLNHNLQFLKESLVLVTKDKEEEDNTVYLKPEEVTPDYLSTLSSSVIYRKYYIEYFQKQINIVFNEAAGNPYDQLACTKTLHEALQDAFYHTQLYISTYDDCKKYIIKYLKNKEKFELLIKEIQEIKKLKKKFGEYHQKTFVLNIMGNINLFVSRLNKMIFIKSENQEINKILGDEFQNYLSYYRETLSNFYEKSDSKRLEELYNLMTKSIDTINDNLDKVKEIYSQDYVYFCKCYSEVLPKIKQLKNAIRKEDKEAYAQLLKDIENGESYQTTYRNCKIILEKYGKPINNNPEKVAITDENSFVWRTKTEKKESKLKSAYMSYVDTFRSATAWAESAVGEEPISATWRIAGTSETIPLSEAEF